ncbi:Protein of unknown function (DUF3128) domain containing protein [Elaphomyces granulatus]
MSWWWTSSTRKDEQQQSLPVPIPPSTPSSNQPASSADSRPHAPPPKQLTRDEQAEAEIKELLAKLQETNEWDDSFRQRNLPIAPSSHAIFFPNGDETNKDSTSTDPPAPSSIVPESLYPDTMSCRSAFDYAFFCQSFGGQWVNVYRYGELRSCSEHWHNFWLCMKANTYPKEEGKRMIRDHYRKKAVKYKTGPSSEDVWEVRTEPLRGAFEGDFAALERQLKEEEEEVMQRN